MRKRFSFIALNVYFEQMAKFAYHLVCNKTSHSNFGRQLRRGKKTFEVFSGKISHTHTTTRWSFSPEIFCFQRDSSNPCSMSDGERWWLDVGVFSHELYANTERLGAATADRRDDLIWWTQISLKFHFSSKKTDLLSRLLNASGKRYYHGNH